MSEVRVNKLSPRSGTTVTLGDSGDTITIPSGVTFDASSGGLAGTLTTAAQPNITSVGTLTSFTSTGIDDNATSTAITIDSSERIGIGTTSPQKTFVVSNSGAEGYEISPTDVSGVIRQIAYNRSSSSHIALRTNASQHEFLVSDSEKMRIDSSGNVGIGTSNPLSKLEISDSIPVRLNLRNTGLDNNGEIVSFQWNNNAIFTIQGRDSNAGFKANWYSITSTATDGLADEHIWYTGSSAERMRIDSSGKVGIGTTSPDSRLEVLDSSATGIISRSTSTQATDTNKGLRVRNNSDTNTFAVSYKGNVFLGSGTGIYFDGSTSGNNALDDYEEGTFTPTVTGSTSGSFTTGDSSTKGSYVKIGNQVTVRGEIHITGSSSPVGSVRVGNLPFTCAALTELSERTTGSCWVKYMDLESTTRSLVVFISQLNSYFQFYEINDNANVTAINSAEVTVPGAEFAFSLTYQTS